MRANVLAVDDSPTLRNILSEVLSRGGHEVFLAQSGEEALDLLDQVHIDIVVADLVMPGMDGYELCRRVKDLNPDCPIPVLLLTSQAHLDAKLAGFQAGADDYILKPFRHEELAARVKAQLRVKSLQEELRDRSRHLENARRELQENLVDLEGAYDKIRSLRSRSETDLALAGKVQRALLPTSAPVISGANLARHYDPGGRVAGDFYDFFPRDDGTLGIVIGDVAGKGVSASLLMVLALTALRQAERDQTSGPAEVLLATHKTVLEQFGQAESITAFYGLYCPQNRRLRYCNAGHEPALLLRAGQDKYEALTTDDTFLGIFPELKLREQEITLDPGDHLLFLTDGVLDRFRPHEGPAATALLQESFLAHRDSDRLAGAWLETLPAPDERLAVPDDATAILLEVDASLVT